ncbi:hypothetical protein DMA11_00595 [Marinilabiliaceae bacterium JC017]|nr:hypothetical protein DMA11_00595 [Marinilabiliaceae bacterium JC017]
MHRYFLRITVFYLLVCPSIQAFNVSDSTLVIKGCVKDKENNEPIPFVSIQLTGSNMGTAGNESGVFIFNIPHGEKTDSLTFSGLGYGQEKVAICQLIGNEVVYLSPKTYELDEVIVKKNDPVVIIKKAIAKIPDNYPSSTFQLRGFYRELVKENEVFTKMAEAVCRFELAPYGVAYDEEAAIYQYIRSDQKAFYNYKSALNIISPFDNCLTCVDEKVEIEGCRSSMDYSSCPVDISICGGPLSLMAMDKAKYNSFDDLHFFDKTWFRRHTFKLKNIVAQGDLRLFEIEMIPKRKNASVQRIAKNAYTGMLYIDTDSYAFVRIDYELHIEDPKGYNSKHPDGFGRKSKIRTDYAALYSYKGSITYSKYQNKWYLKNCFWNWPIDYRYGGVEKSYFIETWRELFVNEVITDSLLPLNPEKLFANQQNNSLYDFPNAYDSVFWTNLNMPPSTRLRDSVRKALEKEHALETQYAQRFHNYEGMEAPVAEEVECKEILWGEKCNDPYKWLEYAWNPKVKKYIQAENLYTQGQMQPYVSLQKKIYRELLPYQGVDSVGWEVDTVGCYVYYRKGKKGLSHKDIYRKNIITNKEELLLDINQLATGHEYYSVDIFRASPDNRYLAYSVDLIGDLMLTYNIIDMVSGELLPVTISNVLELYWSTDSKKVIYQNYNSTGISDKVFVQPIDGSFKEMQIFQAEVPRFDLYLSQTIDKKYFLISEGNQFSNSMYFNEASLNQLNPTLLLPYQEGVIYSVSHQRGHWFVITNRDHKNNGLYCIDDVTGQEQLLAGNTTSYFYSYRITDDYLVINERDNLKDRIRVLSRQTLQELHRIEFPYEVYRLKIDHDDKREHQQKFTLSTFTEPMKTYSLDLENGEVNFIRQESVNGGKEVKYKHKVLYATSADGTSIPISYIYTNKIKKNGKHPVVMMAYGAYGKPVEPEFRYNYRFLLDKGIGIAFPHVRGGNDLGADWWIQGREQNKINTFNDFIAAAQYLLENNYCAPGKLVADGGSAGGLLMGAVANMAPDIFNSIIVQYPLLDMISSLNKSQVIEYEWGDVKNKKEDYEYVKSYSPYDNVVAQNYPNMMFITSMTDERCYYWECAKTVAKLRKHNQADSKILLLTKQTGGHGGSSSYYDYYREDSLVLAFIFANLNIEN